MGKVYSPEEVADSLVPQAGAHNDAAKFILGELSENLLPGFEGALIYGSTTQGNTNIRSDLDILVSYAPGDKLKPSPLRHLQALFKAAQEKYHVSVESNVWRTDQLRKGAHTIDAMLLELLKMVPTEWAIGNSPVDALNIVDTDYQKVANRYLASKVRKFSKAFFDASEKPDPHILQRALELPKAAGRKVLQMFGNDVSNGFDTPFFIEALGESAITFDEVKSYSSAKRLYDNDRQYSDILRRAVNYEISSAQYGKELELMYHGAVENALQLASGLGHIALQPELYGPVFKL